MYIIRMQYVKLKQARSLYKKFHDALLVCG